MYTDKNSAGINYIILTADNSVYYKYYQLDMNNNGDLLTKLITGKLHLLSGASFRPHYIVVMRW